ncbi:MAG: class I adenylate-forming enzyme family protein [Gemmatimonadota bacterium]
MALLESVADLTVAAALASRATSSPEDPFLVFGNDVLTYGQVEMRAEALAASLAEFGVRSGDRVALVLPAWPEYVISLFAVAKLGAIVVPLNPRIVAPELQFVLRQSQAACAVVVETLDDVDYLELFEDLLPRLPDLRRVVTVGKEDLWYDDRIFQFEDALSAGAGRDFDAPAVDPLEHTFALLYTSGTMGKAKAVELSHSSLLAVAATTVRALGLDAYDRVIGVTGLFHAFGIGPGLLGTVLAGAAMVLQESPAVGETLDLIERHGVTVHYGVPPLLRAELDEQRRRPRVVSSLRTGLVSGAALGAELLGALRSELCPGLEVAYTVTETAATVTMTVPGDPGEKRRHTVGRPLPGTELRVLGPDGTPLPGESVGEIAVRGPGRMKGYYRQPRLTADHLDPDGFVRTGDLGLLDEEGYLHLVGRRRDVIIHDGLSVYPLEVESRILDHPAVHSTAVVGVPDRVRGEAIHACVVPEEGAIVTPEEIRDWCAVTLAAYKIPDAVTFLEALPLTGTGKVRRQELARQLSAGTTRSADLEA